MVFAPGPISPEMSKSTSRSLIVLAAIGPAPCSRVEAGFSITSMFWISRSSSVITVKVGALENVSATLLVSLRFPVVGMAILISFTKKRDYLVSSLDISSSFFFRTSSSWVTKFT